MTQICGKSNFEPAKPFFLKRESASVCLCMLKTEEMKTGAGNSMVLKIQRRVFQTDNSQVTLKDG